MKHPLTLHPDPERPRHFVVKDADAKPCGQIDQDSQGDWRNTPVGDKPLPGVALGPFKTVEAAFDAFQEADA